jgi:hypothetical protein
MIRVFQSSFCFNFMKKQNENNVMWCQLPTVPACIAARVSTTLLTTTMTGRIRVAASGHAQLTALDAFQRIAHLIFPRVFTELGKVGVRGALRRKNSIIRHLYLIMRLLSRLSFKHS